MSNDQNKKDPPSENTNVFTIETDNTNTSEVPDIASLLGNSRKAKKTKSVVQEDKTDKTLTNTLHSMIRNLKEFETSIEIHFILREDRYCYLQHSLLSNQEYFGLEEVFQEMKIPQSLVNNSSNFVEFNKNEKGYAFDAFGIAEQPFMEIVFHQNKKILTVYFSGKTMANKKEAVVRFTEQRNKNLSASAFDIAS